MILEWQQAMSSELQALEENGWDLVTNHFAYWKASSGMQMGLSNQI